MLKQRALFSVCLCLMVLGLALPAFAEGSRDYLVVFKDTTLPADAAGGISKAGGVLKNSIPQAGIALATSNDPDFLTKIRQNSAVLSAGLDQKIQVREKVDLSQSRTLSVPRQKMFNKPLTKEVDPTTADFYGFQWNMPQVNAEGAWDEGHFSDPSVTVAVIESGIDYTHPELEGKVDLARSISFVPEEDGIIAERFPGIEPFTDINIGGTLVAAIIACNNVGTACIAPNATLIAVKTVDVAGSSTFFRQIEAIMYSALVGADIIHASFGGGLLYEDPNFDAVFTGFVRAVNIAEQLGSFVVAGVGGVAIRIGFDADRTLLFELWPPAQMTPALGVGGTTPTDQEDFDGRAEWLNYGTTLVDMVAPAGRIDADFFDQILGPCTSHSADVVPQCMVDTPEDEYDWVGFATTNMPSAHVAGAAALLLSEFGDLTPAQLRERILAAVDDIGEPGRDNFFGYGRLNVGNLF